MTASRRSNGWKFRSDRITCRGDLLLPLRSNSSSDGIDGPREHPRPPRRNPQNSPRRCGGQGRHGAYPPLSWRVPRPRNAGKGTDRRSFVFGLDQTTFPIRPLPLPHEHGLCAAACPLLPPAVQPSRPTEARCRRAAAPGCALPDRARKLLNLIVRQVTARPMLPPRWLYPITRIPRQPFVVHSEREHLAQDARAFSRWPPPHR